MTQHPDETHIASGQLGIGTHQGIETLADSPSLTWKGGPLRIVSLSTENKAPHYFEALRISESGKLGIGAIDPKTALHIPEAGLQIGASDSATDNFHITSELIEGQSGLRLWNGNYGSGTHMLSVLPDGNVGIGTTVPASRLHIEGITDTSLTAHGLLVLGPVTGNNLSLDQTKIMARNNGANAPLNLNHEGGDVIINGAGNGNVGIGITNPSAKLEVSGDIRTNVALISDNPHGSNYVAFSHRNQGTAGGYALLQHTGGETYLNTPTGKNINFRVNNSTKMRLLSNGNVGIGTPNPKSKLHIEGITDTSPTKHGLLVLGPLDEMNLSLDQNEIMARNNGAYDTLYLNHQGGDVIINGIGDGNVGIGITNPSAKLEVSGDIRTNVALISDNPHGSNYVAFSHRNQGTAGGYALLQHTGGETYLNTPTGKNINFRVNNSTKMRLLSNGNVGIGTPNPKSKLHIEGITDTSPTKHGLLVLGPLDEMNLSLDQNEIMARNNGAYDTLYLNHQGGDVIINGIGDGNVGIGITNPSAKLEVSGDIRTNVALISDNPFGKNYVAFSHKDQGTKGGYALLQHKDGETYLNTLAGKNINFRVNNSTKMRLLSTGNVGIGTENPSNGLLEIRGSFPYTMSFRHYGRGRNSFGHEFGHIQNYSIFCSHAIAAQEFNAHSDGRTKKVLGKSNSLCDLEILNKLQVTDYTFVDSIEKGNQLQKKLIAQQVKQVYPIAVKTTTDFIPNVYQMSQSTAHDSEQQLLTIKTEKTHSFKVADTVRIVDEDSSREVEVLAIVDDHTFTIASDKGFKEVFVYGKQVDDFLSLDYDSIAMLNVSATQELGRRTEALQSHIKELEEDNASLKTAMAKVTAENARIKSKMTSIETT